MQPHPSQLPHDDAQRPVPKNLKKGALWLLLVLAIGVIMLAWLLPSKQVDAQRAGTSTTQPTPQQQRTATEGYKNPTK